MHFYFLNKLCSKQSLSPSLWKKVCRLEKKKYANAVREGVKKTREKSGQADRLGRLP